MTDQATAQEKQALRELPNVLVSAHIAGAINQERLALADTALEQFAAWQKGQTAAGRVSSAMLEARERARAELQVWLAIAGPAGVQLALETHDSWTNSDELLGLLAGTAAAQVGVVWDVKHPYWMARETPATTWDKLKARIVNIHWKDCRRDPLTGKDQLCLCGAGVLPLADISDLLAAGGYTGCYTLEWERRWHPYLPAPEVAFPQFVQFIRQLGKRGDS